MKLSKAQRRDLERLFVRRHDGQSSLSLHVITISTVTSLRRLHLLQASGLLDYEQISDFQARFGVVGWRCHLTEGGQAALERALAEDAAAAPLPKNHPCLRLSPSERRDLGRLFIRPVRWPKPEAVERLVLFREAVISRSRYWTERVAALCARGFLSVSDVDNDTWDLRLRPDVCAWLGRSFQVPKATELLFEEAVR